MAHTGKEIRFGLIGLFRFLKGGVQHNRAFFQLALQLPKFRYIGNIDKDSQIDRIIRDEINTRTVNLKPAVPAILILHADTSLKRFPPEKAGVIGLQHRSALRLENGVAVQGRKTAEIHIEDIRDAVTCLNHFKPFRKNPVFDNKTRDIIVGDGLFLLNLYHIRDIDHGGVGQLLSVLTGIRKEAHHFNPAGRAIRYLKWKKDLIALFPILIHLVNLAVNRVPAVLIVLKIFIAVVVKQCFILLLRIPNQFVIKMIGPKHGKMFIHQMPADADLHRFHQHLLLILHMYQFRHIGHNGIGCADAVDIFVCEIAEHLHPVSGSILIFHGYNQFILVFSSFQNGLNLIRKHFPALGIISVIFIGMIVKQCLVLCFRIADQFIVMLVGPDTRKMFVNQMLADADIQRPH